MTLTGYFWPQVSYRYLNAGTNGFLGQGVWCVQVIYKWRWAVCVSSTQEWFFSVVEANVVLLLLLKRAQRIFNWLPLVLKGMQCACCIFVQEACRKLRESVKKLNSCSRRNRSTFIQIPCFFVVFNNENIKYLLVLLTVKTQQTG